MVAEPPSWTNVDEWWQRYVEQQAEELNDLESLFRELEHHWEQSPSPYRADPLTVDWSATNQQPGPMRLGQEENWSRWLSQLISDSRGAFTRDLFGEQFDDTPDTVRCERAYHDEELHDRRVDIVGNTGEHGMTIEVKIADENYEKTLQAAYLVEQHDERSLDWSHFLLLPQEKQSVIQTDFEGRFDNQTSRPILRADGDFEVDVTVLFWCDVAQSLRKVLYTDAERTPHWNASAYLCITLIEQQIQRHYPESSITGLETASASIPDIERLQSIDPEEQLSHLRAFVEATTNG